MTDTGSLVRVSGLPILHETPLVRVLVTNGSVVVEADDVSERAIELRFEPFQAVKVLTTDCYIVPDHWTLGNAVFEVTPSAWIANLRENVSQIDETADFMNRARHFVVRLGDEYLEVVAWNVTWTYTTRTDSRQAGG